MCECVCTCVFVCIKCKKGIKCNGTVKVEKEISPSVKYENRNSLSSTQLMKQEMGSLLHETHIADIIFLTLGGTIKVPAVSSLTSRQFNYKPQPNFTTYLQL